LGDPTGRETEIFVKLDSASTLDVALIRRAFPSTPRVFLYRDPLEVLVANMRSSSLFSQNPVLARRCGIGMGESDHTTFAARVLARYLESAIDDQREPGTLLVRWEELPDAFFGRILPHLGVTPSKEEEAAMREVARSDAKSPGRRFVRDSDERRREAPPEVRESAERFLRAPLGRLEVLRAAQIASSR
jgi:hypothetical protein